MARPRAVNLIRYPVDWHVWAKVRDIETADSGVAIIGRVEPRKGHMLLIEAMGRVSARRAPVLAIGRAYDLGFRDILQKRAEALGVEVDWVGPVERSELPELLARVRVVAMPSEFDSFGMAATEAMAAGRPVVASAGVGAGELGYGIDVMPSREPGAWAAALERYLIDDHAARDAGKAGRAATRDQCDPETVAAQRVECYRATADTRAARRRQLLRPSAASAPTVHRCAPRWYEWAAAEASEEPWRHFYLATAEQLLGLLKRARPDLEERGLDGVRICDLAATPPLSAMLVELGAEVTQLDIERSELVKARSILHDLGLVDGGLVCGDAFRPPFRSEAFDIVWNSGFIEHFGNPVSIVTDMARLVRPGGAVCVLVPASFTLHTLVARPLARRRGGYFWDWVGKEGDFTARSLATLLRRSGLDVVAASRANIRRSLVDDRYVLRLERRAPLRPVVGAAMRAADSVERSFPPARALGFMAGAVGMRR